uniref:Zinc finger and BTB domain containing 25 n=1 Tax=Gallus gallus TaxID=9031 RepID=A0A8V0Z358_CHICK
MDMAGHSLLLLQQLNMQREFGFLCDCTVAIGDVYFKAHRAVLAAFSNYFKMIFIHQTRCQLRAIGSQWPRRSFILSSSRPSHGQQPAAQCD